MDNCAIIRKMFFSLLFNQMDHHFNVFPGAGDKKIQKMF